MDIRKSKVPIQSDINSNSLSTEQILGFNYADNEIKMKESLIYNLVQKKETINALKVKLNTDISELDIGKETIINMVKYNVHSYVMIPIFCSILGYWIVKKKTNRYNLTTLICFATGYNEYCRYLNTLNSDAELANNYRDYRRNFSFLFQNYCSNFTIYDDLKYLIGIDLTKERQKIPVKNEINQKIIENILVSRFI